MLHMWLLQMSNLKLALFVLLINRSTQVVAALSAGFFLNNYLAFFPMI